MGLARRAGKLLIGHDAVLLVVRDLLFAVCLRDAQQVLDCVRLLVGVEYDAPLLVACSSARRLHERSRGPQEPLFVGVENRDERYFRKVKALAQEVDSDENVELAFP